MTASVSTTVVGPVLITALRRSGGPWALQAVAWPCPALHCAALQYFIVTVKYGKLIERTKKRKYEWANQDPGEEVGARG